MEIEENVEALIASMRQNKWNFRKLGDLYFAEEERILKLPPDKTLQELIVLTMYGSRDWRKTCLFSLFLARVWNKCRTHYEEVMTDLIVRAIQHGYEPHASVDDGVTKDAKTLALVIIGNREAIQYLKDVARSNGIKDLETLCQQIHARIIMAIASREDE